MGGTMMPSPRASNAAPGVASGSPARRCLAEASAGFAPSRRSACASVTHLPDLVMPIGTTSNLLLSMALSTEAADSSETSCSPLRPPKRTPIFSFFIRKPIYHGVTEARSHEGDLIDITKYVARHVSAGNMGRSDASPARD